MLKGQTVTFQIVDYDEDISFKNVNSSYSSKTTK